MNKAVHYLLLFLFAILATIACRKYDVNVNDTRIKEVPASFSGFIDGRRVTWTADSLGYMDTAFVFTEFFPDSSYASFVSSIEKPGRMRFELIRKRLAFAGNYPSQFEFRNYFLQGTYSFAYSLPRITTNGFVIAYSDGGTDYTTEGINTSQSPGSIRITSLVDGINSKGQYQVNIECTFNGILYPRIGPPEGKSVTQATFRGSFIYQ